MSGLLALLDDVAAIAKSAAASIDDIAGQAAKAGAKAAASAVDDAAKAGSKAVSVVIDDAAVTPKYVQGFPAARELPIVGRIAAASLRNKLLILLPAALLLSAFAPWMITPLLMLGGCYLCFEGAEKILHLVQPQPHAASEEVSVDAARLEETRVAGAIKTDFILSAEIMTIALAALPADTFLNRALALALVALGITALIYGSVALIVKADDIGLRMAERGRLAATRALGRGIVRGMPGFMVFLSTVGTAAMLWVGGSILVHGLEDLGFAALGHGIAHLAEVTGHALSAAEGFVRWLVTALLDGLFGLAAGLVLVPLVGLGLRLAGRSPVH